MMCNAAVHCGYGAVSTRRVLFMLQLACSSD